MLYTILAGIALLFTVVCLLFAAGGSTPNGDHRPGIRGRFAARAAAGALVFVLLTVLFSVTIVSARTVAIYTSFGKEQGTKPAGFGWTAPWYAKAEFPTSVQYLELNAGKDAEGATNVSYKGGGQGQVDSTIRWTLDPTKALDLWRKYREFDRVTEQLVKSAARDSIGVSIGTYAPNEARAGENRREITDKVVADLNRTLSDDGIRIDSVSITDVRLDGKTQASIEDIIKANAAIEKARAEQERAKIDAATAKIREAGGSLSQNALVRYCLELTNGWNDDNNGALPATWSCFPGAQSAGVLVNR